MQSNQTPLRSARVPASQVERSLRSAGLFVRLGASAGTQIAKPLGRQVLPEVLVVLVSVHLIEEEASVEVAPENELPAIKHRSNLVGKYFDLPHLGQMTGQASSGDELLAGKFGDWLGVRMHIHQGREIAGGFRNNYGVH